MLKKLIKHDLKDLIMIPALLALVAIVLSSICRLLDSINYTNVFLAFIRGTSFGVSIGFIIACIVQVFVRIIVRFAKNFYGDESYLTHTLPVEKRWLLASKAISSFITLIFGFASVALVLVILFYDPNNIELLKAIIAQESLGNNSIPFSVTVLLFVFEVLTQYTANLSLIFIAIVLGAKSNQKKVKKTILWGIGLSFLSSAIIGTVSTLIVVAFNLGLSSIYYTLIIGVLYIISAVTFYLIARKEFVKGVNVD